MIAPGMLNDVNTNGPTDPLAGTGNANTRYANYDILYIPVEVKWNMWEKPWKVFYTYAHNFSANQVAQYNQGRPAAINPGLVGAPNGPPPPSLPPRPTRDATKATRTPSACKSAKTRSRETGCWKAI